MTVRRIATCLALTAFALAIFMGMAAENDAYTAMSRALIAMGVTYFAGLFLATVGQHAVTEHLKDYREANPIHPDGEDDPNDTLAEDAAELMPQDAAAVTPNTGAAA